MASDYDATEFIDGDLQAHKSQSAALASPTLPSQRAPTREEVDSKVVDAQQRLAELKRAQEDLERQRAALEETRRRQSEFETGRQEMVQNLTRALGLLEEGELAARCDAEQMGKALGELRDALNKVQAVHEEMWTKDNFAVELTRGLTTLENARMEWNAARLKFPLLSGTAQPEHPKAPKNAAGAILPLQTQSFGQLCRMGLALTWPLATVALLALGFLIALLWRR
ncbi:MAG: hypothetical protein C5B50_18525 [Verrucomicrobia bacterium]|nr:MAG: hypothetical protein C5B50_18525 [Verrucomicrobiota bacterium]